MSTEMDRRTMMLLLGLWLLLFMGDTFRCYHDHLFKDYHRNVTKGLRMYAVNIVSSLMYIQLPSIFVVEIIISIIVIPIIDVIIVIILIVILVVIINIITTMFVVCSISICIIVNPLSSIP